MNQILLKKGHNKAFPFQINAYMVALTISLDIFVSLSLCLSLSLYFLRFLNFYIPYRNFINLCIGIIRYDRQMIFRKSYQIFPPNLLCCTLSNFFWHCWNTFYTIVLINLIPIFSFQVSLWVIHNLVIILWTEKVLFFSYIIVWFLIENKTKSYWN